MPDLDANANTLDPGTRHAPRAAVSTGRGCAQSVCAMVSAESGDPVQSAKKPGNSAAFAVAAGNVKIPADSRQVDDDGEVQRRWRSCL
jgi:hypothetical protein